jgi:hypothetical protein
MRKSTGFSVTHALILAAVASMCVGSVAVAQDYEQEPIILKAKDFLSPELLRGENYRVMDEVKNDGLINTYELGTDYGLLTVESSAELMIRIDELNALKTMEELDRRGTFRESLVKGVKAPVEGAVALVKSPIETSKDIARGTGVFLSSVGRSIVSSDPYQDNVVKVALGYDAAKRQFAYEFGIDPYSSYGPLTQRLGKISRSAVAGGLIPRAVMMAISHPVATAASISGTAKTMKELVRDNPPGVLWKINQKKLEEMGVDPALADAFLKNYHYNPQEKTILVGELESMKGVEGRDAFISVASLATEESVALHYRLIAQMMAAYHANIAPIESIRNISGRLCFQREDDVLVFALALDNVFWTKDVEHVLNTIDNEIGEVFGKELWVTGKMDETAAKHFGARDWKIMENANDLFLKRIREKSEQGQ